MDRLKRTVFPAVIFIVILIVLVYRLSSCASNSAVTATKADASASLSSAALPSVSPSASSPPAIEPSASPSPSPSPTLYPTSSPKPSVKYTNDDIIQYYRNKGFEVRDIRDAGSVAVVMYASQDISGDTPVSFAWFDRITGTRDVAVAGVLADRFVVTSDKRLTVLTTGRNYVNGKQWFPEIIISDFGSGAEAPRYFSGSHPYFMPTSRSFTVSDDAKHESIRSITFDFDAVSVGFVPQKGRESEFDTGYRYIPKTSVVCSSGYCYVTFYNTTLTSGFTEPEDAAGDGLRTFVSVKSDGTNTLLTLKLGVKTARFNISTGYSPDDGMPYAVLKFRTNEGSNPNYPVGW